MFVPSLNESSLTTTDVVDTFKVWVGAVGKEDLGPCSPRAPVGNEEQQIKK